MDDRLDGMTPEDITRAKETCMCGVPVADHDDTWLGHSPCSVYDYMTAPADPFTDEIEGIEEIDFYG